MKKFLLLAVMSLFLISLVSAIPPVQSTLQGSGIEIAYPQFDTVPINTGFNLSIHAVNSTKFLTNLTTSCFIHLYSSDGLPVLETLLTFSGNEYQTKINSNNFSQLGYHSYIIGCNSSTQAGFVNGIYNITPNGKNLDMPTVLLYSLIILGLAVLFFYALMSMLENSYDYGWRVGFGLSAYIITLVVSFLTWNFSYNYLFEIPLLANVLNIMWIVLAVLLPIVLILVAFSLLKEQAKEATTQRKQKYGYSREEASR